MSWPEPAGRAGTQGWLELRALATAADCDVNAVVDAINGGDLAAYRIRGVVLIPFESARSWLNRLSRPADDLPAWDPSRAGSGDTDDDVDTTDLLTVVEAAEILAVTPNRVYGIIRTRRMPGRTVNGRIWVHRDDLDAYIQRTGRSSSV